MARRRWIWIAAGMWWCGRLFGAEPPVVVLVSVDGLRADYLEVHRPPHLARLAKEGALVEKLIPCFPTKTFPNHYTLVTGLLPAHHGIVANDMYDPEWSAVFHIGAHPAPREGRWWEGEPIWNTAERQGLVAACLFWPGSEAPVGGRYPTHWRRYDSSLPLAARVEQVLAWLSLPRPERPSIITLYFSRVDSAGHDFGPLSEKTRDALLMIDAAIGELASEIRSRGLDSFVNLIVTADHGMQETSPEQIVFIDDYVDLDRVRVEFEGPVGGLRPIDAELSATDLKECFSGLKPRLEACLRSELPERFKFSGHRRIPPVILLPAPGWQVVTRAKFATWKPETVRGAHGYDPELPSMATALIGHGPAFQHSTVVSRASNLDVYNLMCAILGVEAAANDGSMFLVERLLRR